MNKKEREQLVIFNQLKERQISQKEVACKLRFSTRWVRKKKQRYFKHGDKGNNILAVKSQVLIWRVG